MTTTAATKYIYHAHKYILCTCVCTYVLCAVRVCAFHCSFCCSCHSLDTDNCTLRFACCVLRTAREASPPSSLSRVRVRAGSQTSWTDQPAGHVNSGNNNNNDKERLPSVKVNMQKGRGRDKVRMERERGAGREREGEQVKCWQLRNVSFKDVSPVRAGMTYRFEAWEFSRPARKRERVRGRKRVLQSGNTASSSGVRKCWLKVYRVAGECGGECGQRLTSWSIEAS